MHDGGKRPAFTTLLLIGLFLGVVTSGTAQSTLPLCLPEGTNTDLGPPGFFIPPCDPGQDPGVDFPAGGSPLFPDSPPVASLITLSVPDSAGMVTVTGSPGATTSGAYLLFVTLDTGHYITTQAGSDGGFTAIMFAPAGTSVMLKADVFGGAVTTFVADPTAGAAAVLTGLAGTILRVGDPTSSSAGVAFAGAGLVGSEEPPAWTFEGTLDATTVQPGDSLTVQGNLSILDATLNPTGNTHARLGLERVSNADGSGTFAQGMFASAILTPTGFPVERGAIYSGSALVQIEPITMMQAGDNITGPLEVTLELPSNLPSGYYRPFMSFGFGNTATAVSYCQKWCLGD